MKKFTNENVMNDTQARYAEMKEIANGIKNAELRETQTYSFARYGNNHSSASQAIAEILWNAFGAGKAKTVWVVYNYQTHMLRILNDGEVVDLNKVFQYGRSSRSHQLSYYGTGATNTAAFFNPSNTMFGMNAKVRNFFKGIRAPFCSKMAVGDLDDATIEAMNQVSPKATTEFFVLDENEVLVDFDFKKSIGRICALAILNGKKVYFNGKKVDAILPDCGQLGTPKTGAQWQNEELIETEEGNFVLQWSQIDATEAEDANQESQGGYLYFNDMFMEHMGMRMFSRKGQKKDERMSAHNYFNHMRTIVNVVTEGVENPLQIPFNNSKTAISWGKAAARALRSAIDERTSECYKQTYNLNCEKGKRKAIDHIAKTMFWGAQGVVKYDTEVQLKPEGLRCDAMIYTGAKFSIDNVRSGKTVVLGIVEYKKAKLNCNHVGQAITYLMNAAPADCGVAMPRLILVGGQMSKYVKTCIDNVNGRLRADSQIEYKALDYNKLAHLYKDLEYQFD